MWEKFWRGRVEFEGFKKKSQQKRKELEKPNRPINPFPKTV